MLEMLATLAEYERELITERADVGIAAAKESSARFGRPTVDPVEVAEKIALARDARKRGAPRPRPPGWSRSTLYLHMQAADLAETAR